MSTFRTMIFALSVLAAGPAMAQDQGDVVVGRELAAKWCDNCHVVNARQSNATSTGAPTFDAIAADKRITPMSIEVFLQTPHARMPDLHLDRNEIDDLTAYIFSLREK